MRQSPWQNTFSMTNEEQILETLKKLLEIQEQVLATQKKAAQVQQVAVDRQQAAIKNQLATGKIYRVSLGVGAVLVGLLLYYVINLIGRYNLLGQ